MPKVNLKEIGKATRFTSENQPQNRGRKPSLYKKLKALTGKKVGWELEKGDYYDIIRWVMEQSPSSLEHLVKDSNGKPDKNVPLWLLNIISALNTDIRYGRTATVEMIFDRIFGRPTQTVESEINAEVTNKSVDLSALSIEELLQYNALLEKIKQGSNGTK